MEGEGTRLRTTERKRRGHECEGTPWVNVKRRTSCLGPLSQGLKGAFTWGGSISVEGSAKGVSSPALPSTGKKVAGEGGGKVLKTVREFGRNKKFLHNYSWYGGNAYKRGDVLRGVSAMEDLRKPP